VKKKMSTEISIHKFEEKGYDDIYEAREEFRLHRGKEEDVSDESLEIYSRKGGVKERENT
jgi:hypothetical protein